MSHVSPSSAQLPVPAGIPRCPACGALTPPSATGVRAQWCSLCLAPLQVISVEVNDLTTLPLPVTGPLPHPEVVPLDPSTVDQMFTVLKEQTEDPWVARSKKFSTRGQRIGLAIAVGVGLVVLVMIGSFVVGRLLG